MNNKKHCDAQWRHEESDSRRTSRGGCALPVWAINWPHSLHASVVVLLLIAFNMRRVQRPPAPLPPPLWPMKCGHKVLPPRALCWPFVALVACIGNTNTFVVEAPAALLCPATPLPHPLSPLLEPPPLLLPCEAITNCR